MTVSLFFIISLMPTKVYFLSNRDIFKMIKFTILFQPYFDLNLLNSLKSKNNLKVILLTKSWIKSWIIRKVDIYFVFKAEVDKERASLENVPSNYIESVCMPDFDEFFQQAGGAGYPLPEHKVTPVMNGGNSGPSSSSGASSSTSASFIDGKSLLLLL